MPILISDQMKELLTHFQEQWRPLAEQDKMLEEETLSTFTKDLGIKHRKESPELYTKNALKILDFYALMVPGIAESVILENKDRQTVLIMQAIASRSAKHIDSSAFYLDDKHCVPNLLAVSSQDVEAENNREKLFKKVCLLESFMREFYSFDKKTKREPATTVLITQFIDSHYDNKIFEEVGFITRIALKALLLLLPDRKRLTTLGGRINDFEKLNGVSRPNFPKFELKKEATHEEEKKSELRI